MADFNIVEDDTSPAFDVVLRDGFKQPINLTGATVVFSMRLKPSGAVKVSAGIMGAVGNAVDGRQAYNFSTSDTDTAGDYEAEVRATFSNGTVRRIPSVGYIAVAVKDNVV